MITTAPRVVLGMGVFTKRLKAGLFVWALVSSAALAAEPLDGLRKAAQAEIEEADTATMFKKVELGQKYAAALENLEKTLTASGNLDAIVHIRQEKEAVLKSGQPTAYADKPLVELRDKYQKSIASIDGGMKASRAKVLEGIAKKIKEQEVGLTRAGKVDDALKFRKDGEQMMLELSSGAAASTVGFADDPRSTTAPDLNPLSPIKIPDDKPKLVENPFAIKGRWLEGMTLPVMKQKIREPIVIGERSKKVGPLIVMSPGSVMSASGDGRIDVAYGRFVASKCRFETVPMFGDLGSVFFFQNCSFDNCRFKKGGNWHGWDQASKFYFENCYFKGSFSDTINLVQNGFRVQSSVFEDMELPTMRFFSKQPADYLSHPWLRVIHCRFIKCKIPLSFVYLTRDCIFEKCVFNNESERPGDEAEITKPFEIVAYEESTRSIGLKFLPS
ncbi:MAG: hypothetical protein ABI162_10470 [Luteolibacter sp.]